MPPLGWTKPPGYGGFQRASTKTRGIAKKKRPQRTAGPHMLRGARAVSPDPPTLSVGPDLASDAASDVDDDDDVDDHAEENQGKVSSRLRLRKGAPPTVDDDADVSGASGSEHADMPDLEGQDSSGSEDDEFYPIPLNGVAARASRAAAAHVVVSDDDEPLLDAPDIAAQPAAGAAEPDNSNLHVLELSVTLSKSKGHVNPAWLQLIYNWMQQRTLAAAAALERGGKQQHLHLQIMLRMQIAEQDIEALKLELKTLVGWRRGDGSGCYCSAKLFGAGQARAAAHTPLA